MVEYCALIIDDDIWMQRILSKTLQSYGFRKTLLASDGYEGVNLAIEHIPDVIILDILMPDLSGHQTLKLLRTIKKTKHIPVLMVSALSDTENLGKAIRLGVNGFISKPFTRTTVFEKLVSIFGPDRMERISAGLPIDRSYLEEEIEIPTTESTNLTESSQQISTGSVQISGSIQEKISQSYKEEDEQKSIEAIKKLLLKTKKSSE
ncbi:response regulator [Bacteroidetes/Chlorobi group bacterium Naka2016]|jgi:CheY-like chemotaxis protein|nr:MAG: response regulator [Bacteroidetes/Chlorobi group bacterium Naka2016]